MSKNDGSELISIWPVQIAFGNRSIDVLYDHANEHRDISKKEIKYFLLLMQRPYTQRELSDLCATDQANTARAITSLTEKGLVEMGEKIDGRSYSVRLTSEGRELCEHMLRSLVRQLLINTEDVTEEEYQAFVKVLKRVHSSI